MLRGFVCARHDADPGAAVDVIDFLATLAGGPQGQPDFHPDLIPFFIRSWGRGPQTRTLFLVAALLGAMSSPARAQVVAGAPDPATVKLRLGPLYMNPTMSLTNLGVDTNVFNDFENPKRDFTLTAEPKTDLWLRIGNTWISGQIGEQVIWYQKYATERSSNNRYLLGWSVPLNRLSFRVGGSYVKTRDRPKFEIDARAQRVEKGLDGAVDFRLLAKTSFGVRAVRNRTNFADRQIFRGQDLQAELNRTSTTTALTVRNQLTPLTSLDLDLSRIQDRFEFSPLRNSDSTAVAGGLRFDPFALLKGTASFGYRQFKPLAPDVPGFTGLTVAIDLSYVLQGSTRFNVTATRDVNYSIDVNQPYYLLTGVAASIAQQVFGPVDVVARFGKQRLGYVNRTGAVVVAPDRVDYATSYGIGFGYHLGTDLRLGFNVDQSRRESPLDSRRYEGLTFGTAVTFGS